MMELSHKPKWASRLMETVELSEFFRHCPLSEKDKKEIRKCPKRRRGHEAEYEMEDIYFWIGGLIKHRRIFTTLVAYFKMYIYEPDCCKNNNSMVRMTIADCENPKIKEKLCSGQEMLDKIINIEENFFPNDKDKSIFGKVQFFYNTFANFCISCGETFDGGECWCCATRRIQMEELFHVENIWYNTGRQNVYTALEPFYSRDMQQGFCVALITQRLDENKWYLAERATIQHFLGCSKRTEDRIPSLFLLCVNTITDRYDAEKMSYLPLPPAMKKQLLDMLFLPERHITDAILHKYSTWVRPVDEELAWRPRGCYFYTDTEDGVSC